MLRTPDSGRCKFFIYTRLKDHTGWLQELGGTLQLLIVGTNRRTPITGDKRTGIKTLAFVTFNLHHGQSHQCLRAIHERTATGGGVFVVEVMRSTHETVPRLVADTTLDDEVRCSICLL